MAASQQSDTHLRVVCAGELLWDAGPGGIFLGGAPANVAVHLRSLDGISSAVISRVGSDDLGDEALLRLQERGVDTSHVQRDAGHPTGFVRVTFAGAEPSYDVRPAAWDHLKCTDDALAVARTADALVFGSIAQREPTSRAAVQALVAATSRAVFDVNFRPPFVHEAAIMASAKNCWLLKLNHEEAATMAEAWLHKAAAPQSGSGAEAHARALGVHFCCHCVVTCGGDGAVLYLHDSGRLMRHGGCTVAAIDAVGAGDAFLACLLHGMLLPGGTQPEVAACVLARANAVGAFVATQRGATPTLDWAAIHKLVDSAPATRDVTV